MTSNHYDICFPLDEEGDTEIDPDCHPSLHTSCSRAHSNPYLTEARHVSVERSARKAFLQQRPGFLKSEKSESNAATDGDDTGDNDDESRMRMSELYPRISMSTSNLTHTNRLKTIQHRRNSYNGVRPSKPPALESSLSSHPNYAHSAPRAKQYSDMGGPNPTLIPAAGCYGSTPSVATHSNHSSPSSSLITPNNLSPFLMTESTPSDIAVSGDSMPLAQECKPRYMSEEAGTQKAAKHNCTFTSLNSTWHDQIWPPLGHRPRQLRRLWSEISLGDYYGEVKSPFPSRPQYYRGVTIPPIPYRPSVGGSITTDHFDPMSYSTRVGGVIRPCKVLSGSNTLKRAATDTKSRGFRALEEQRQLNRTTSGSANHAPLLYAFVKCHRCRLGQNTPGSSSNSWKSHLPPLPEPANLAPGFAAWRPDAQSTNINDDLATKKAPKTSSIHSAGTGLNIEVGLNAGDLPDPLELSKRVDGSDVQSMLYGRSILAPILDDEKDSESEEAVVDVDARAPQPESNLEMHKITIHSLDEFGRSQESFAAGNCQKLSTCEEPGANECGGNINVTLEKKTNTANNDPYSFEGSPQMIMGDAIRQQQEADRTGTKEEIPLWRLSLLHIMEQHRNDQQLDCSPRASWRKVFRKLKNFRIKRTWRN